jgi:Tfp pilus assembly protein PilF
MADTRAEERVRAAPPPSIPSAVESLSIDPAVDPLAVDPLALTVEMRRFADSHAGEEMTRKARLLGLHEGIFDPDDGLGITYGSAATHTAAGTFDARSGNCLSFTFLFVALARHAGLSAYFVEVDQVMGWSQRGDLGLSHWHMFVEVEIDNAVVQVDFLPWSDRRYRTQRRIDETRAQAHYHSNMGAEALTRGEVDRALEHFDRALQLDASFSPARVNRAVAHRRAGEPEKAETDLLDVLTEEPSHEVAATNLASLYLGLGREDDARRWLRQRDAFLARNPFHHFRLGMQALQDGAFDTARAHFKRAIARQPNEPLFFEHLATAYLRLGESRRGRASLRRALYLPDEPERRQRLEARLDGLEATPGGA